MFDVFLDYLKKIIKSRLLPITIIYIALFAVIINRLFYLQIVKGPEIVKNNELKATQQREIKSTRGNIYDCNGKLLASNVLSYAVVMDDSSEIETNDQRNAIIHELINIIEKNGDTLDNEFYIDQDAQGNLEFTVDGTALTRFLKQVYTYIIDDRGTLTEDQKRTYLKSNYDYLVNNKTTVTDDQKKQMVKDAYEFLRVGTDNNFAHMFDISGDYSVADILKIMGVRYALFCNYKKYLQITIASDVSDLTVAAVKENGADLPGVDIQQQTRRVYEDALYFAHIIGYTGLISGDVLDEKTAAGEDYNSSDYIGKAGIEKEYEDQLRGTKGSETVSVNPSGKEIDVIAKTDPVAGNDIYLTIDSDLQRNCYHLLEREITEILLQNIVPDMNYGSKGVSATDIKIPIYEVYYALINNNIIDINAFNDSNATELEKQTYSKYLDERNNVFSKYDQLLSMNNTIVNSKADDMEEFLNYFYEVLKSDGILLKDSIPKDDTEYNEYVNGNISLSSFLQYAIAHNWINLEKLGVGKDYMTSEEIYKSLIDYTKNLLESDSTFNKKIYRKLVFSYNLSGTEICLLLFDQGVLEYKEDDVNKLKSGSYSAYNFITDKIKSLEITPAMLALEPCSGSLVITDVNTGAVKALVTYPSYDNNLFANKVDYSYFTKLQNDLTKPQINRAVSSRIAPGSTFKMVTSFAALDEGVVTPSEKIYDEGIFTKISPPPKCHIYPSSHGWVNLADALKVSCNYFFYEMGWRLSLNNQGIYDENIGLTKLQQYATLFGLNEKSGIELDEQDPVMSTNDAVRSAIGQGSNAYTPSQLARYVTTLASHGKCYDLTILGKIVDKDGNVSLDNSAAVIHDLSNVSSTTWNTVLQGMYDVVNDPNGGSVYSTFKDFPITVAGKTGTSQISRVSPNNALFLSFAPFDKPEISLAVVIPNGYTSHNAADLAKNVYSLYFGLVDPKSLLEGDVKVSNANSGGAIE